MKDSEILAAAQDLIREPATWTKGTWCRGYSQIYPELRDAYCMEGALRKVLQLQVDLEPLDFARAYGHYMTLCDELRHIGLEMYPNLPKSFGAVASINDDPDITHADVMAICDKTRAHLEEMGR